MNFSHIIHKGFALKDDIYILSSQANQAFYVEDDKGKRWAHDVSMKPRDSYQLGANMTVDDDDDDDESYPQCAPPNM